MIIYNSKDIAFGIIFFSDPCLNLEALSVTNFAHKTQHLNVCRNQSNKEYKHSHSKLIKKFQRLFVLFALLHWEIICFHVIKFRGISQKKGFPTHAIL